MSGGRGRLELGDRNQPADVQLLRFRAEAAELLELNEKIQGGEQV
jgi:hypothetical protein